MPPILLFSLVNLALSLAAPKGPSALWPSGTAFPARIESYQRLVEGFGREMAAQGDVWRYMPEVLVDFSRPTADGGDGVAELRECVDGLRLRRTLSSGAKRGPDEGHSLAESFALLDKLVVKEEELAWIKGFAAAIESLHAFRSKINEFVRDIKVQSVIGQPGNLFRKMGAEIERQKLALDVQIDAARGQMAQIASDAKIKTVDEFVETVGKEGTRKWGRRLDLEKVERIAGEYRQLRLYRLLSTHTSELQGKLFRLLWEGKGADPPSSNDFFGGTDAFGYDKYARGVRLVHAFVLARKHIPSIAGLLDIYEKPVKLWFTGKSDWPAENWVAENGLEALKLELELNVAKVLYAFFKMKRFYALDDFFKKYVKHNYSLAIEYQRAMDFKADSGVPSKLEELVREMVTPDRE